MQQRTSIIALVVAALFVGFATLVIAADPTAPASISQTGSSTFNSGSYAAQTVPALAGNITSLVVLGIGQTKAWQGYYGNITATVTLDDANNFTFYNWSATEPRGQIYATLNSSITWTGVQCFNFTNTSQANEVEIEAYYSISTDDVDGVDETFSATNHPSFQVGSRTLTGCPTTYINQNDAAQTSNFVNVLLYDPAINATGWIYTALIENKTAGSSNDLVCYNNQPCDFQILVNENGHGTDTSTTTYYFWVEIV